MISMSLIVQSTQFVYQEKILSSYEVPPQRIVGLEGMFGMIFMFNWLMLFTFLPCPSPDLCQVKNSKIYIIDGRTVRGPYCCNHRDFWELGAYVMVLGDYYINSPIQLLWACSYTKSILCF